jgi:6,7-dimethyl-8-ribityllumazine synthase
MNDADRGQAEAIDGDGLHIAVVRARFNDGITRPMLDDCINTLVSLGVNLKHIEVVNVPGALEIPTALAVLAEAGDFDAMVAIGCVIRGETYHFNIVSDQSAAGIMAVSTAHRLPIANAILTVENEAQAQARAATHGGEAARVAVEMVNALDDWL